MIGLAQVGSPLGPLAIAECAGRLMAIEFGVIDDLLRAHPELAVRQCLRATGPGPAATAVLEFLRGESERVHAKVDLSLVPGPFDREVLRRLFRSKKGETFTYGQLARELERPGASRAVGGAMRRNPIPIAIPCHRVLPSTGGLGNYTGGVDKKAWLLAREGVTLPGVSRKTG